MQKHQILTLLLIFSSNLECSISWTQRIPPTLRSRKRQQRRTSSSRIAVGSAKNQPSVAETKECNRNRDWHVWRAADRLAETMEGHPLTPAVIRILRLWDTQWADHDTQQNVLNKSNLLHEIEESMAALGFLMEWMNSPSFKNNYKTINLIDICCGKGICSLLASYLFANDSRVSNILMMDKPENDQNSNNILDWSHVEVANEFAIRKIAPSFKLEKRTYSRLTKLSTGCHRPNNKSRQHLLEFIFVKTCRLLILVLPMLWVQVESHFCAWRHAVYLA
jgi:hypothetical protein